MTLTFKTRMLAALVATLLALGSSMSSARADETPHDGPVDAPAPTTDAGHHEEVALPGMARKMAGGNARTYSDGDELSYRVKVTQSLQPKGPQAAGPVSGTLELVLTERVTEDDDGPLVTVEVTEANAEGFLAVAEEESALGRELQLRPESGQMQVILKEDSNGDPDLTDAEAISAFGDPGAIRMVDLAIWSHLLNPVIPSDDYQDGESFTDTAALPSGWSLGHRTVDGSITVEGPATEEGRDVVRVKGVHVSNDGMLRVRAMDNAVEALQGQQKPVPNDFFAGTIFNALFPEGSTYESLMPPLPLKTAPAQRMRPVKARKRSRRGTRMVIACLMTLLGLAACNNPAQNEGVVSLNLQGPVQLNHRSVVDRETGVLISSEVDATANLTGNVHKIPPELLEAVPENLRSLAGVEVGMDAKWTVTEELAGEVPERSAFASIAPKALIGVGFALLALALILSLRRRKSRQPEHTPEPEETGSA
jgi:uncharacterized membrane protein